MKKCLLAILMVVALLSTAAMAATTATVPVNIHLTGGTLAIGVDEGNRLVFNDANLADVLASPTTFIAHSTEVPTFWVQDYTGDNMGWHVTMTCTNLTNAQAKVLDVTYAHAGTELLTEYNGQAAVANQGPMKVAASTRANVPTSGSALSVVKANTGYGNGKYHFDFVNADDDFQVPIGKNQAYAGDYTGTLTVTLTAGPGGTGSWSGHIE